MTSNQVRNKQIKLKHYVLGKLEESDFQISSNEITLELNDNNDVLVKNLYLSCDPYMRHRMRGETNSYIPPYQEGQVLDGYGVSKVVLSNNSSFKVGDCVSSWTRWEEYSVIPRGQRLKVIDPALAPLSYHAGALGMAGFTAYVGFFEVLKPKKGETLFVSAASGAVGQLVGQLARDAGLYVVGSAGSQEKIDLLTNKLGYNAAFNYKEEPDLVAAVAKYCPQGVDKYFENVGGKTLDAVLDNMNNFGRVAVCGLISQYDQGGQDGVYNLKRIINKRVTLQGFLQSDYLHLEPKFMDHMSKLIKADKLVYFEDFAEGLDNAPNAFCRMMIGSKIGKQVITVAKD